jgi:hypothetical protein
MPLFTPLQAHVVPQEHAHMSDEPFMFRQPPASLFRYQRFSEWLRPAIVHGELYYAILHELNDPCEYCYRIDARWDDRLAREQLQRLLRSNSHTSAVQAANPSLRIDAIRAAMRAMPFEELFDTVKRGALGQSESERKEMIDAQLRIDAATIGICCLTENGQSSYMSNSYADRHSGVCLEFSTAVHPFALAQPVTYQDSPPTLRPIGDPASMQRARMFVKGSEWRQEREWRVTNHRVADGPVGRYAPKLLVSIALCPNFSESNLPPLRTWLDERAELGHAWPVIYRLVRRQESYGLERVRATL